MGLYTSVTGWVRYYGATEAAAIRRAIAGAAEKAPDRRRDVDREFIAGYAAQVAAGWQFIGEGSGSGASSLAVWNGVVRNRNSFLIRDQVEAIAAVLRPDHDMLPDGRIGYWLQGLFDVRVEEGPALEWRVYGGALHENEREIPLSREQRSG